VKSIFLVPVIEELLDELGEASWFSSLDLTAGYHQILLKSDDIAKPPSKRILGIMNSM
jgi:hypothetical protein